MCLTGCEGDYRVDSLQSSIPGKLGCGRDEIPRMVAYTRSRCSHLGSLRYLRGHRSHCQHEPRFWCGSFRTLRAALHFACVKYCNGIAVKR
ncbi:hypothetical protein AAFF_G00126890 [Aldrovandia affinis]|uniref:Uncharacterized protein n=1 Tax=Aldrovandia affinis TaxID=143900 RepID=A0AAD7T1L8_9TELE|nr:hypothetical protein AAFF_G00126890 [Aldrovandia affinis]